MKIAVLHDAFPGAAGIERLDGVLGRARERGAALAALAELPMDAWIPASRQVRDGDAEPIDGPRSRALARVAARHGIAVAGGAIVIDENGRRRNRALLFDGRGESINVYDKVHLPSEDGFWESDHYEPGESGPRVVDDLALRTGMQVCSDLQRPQGCQLLAALGVELILAPRATPASNQERWRTVIRANAITSATFVVSANRPLDEPGVGPGGASLVVAPDGRVVAESAEPLFFADLDPQEVRDAKHEYPGYLELPAAHYARCWSAPAGASD